MSTAAALGVVERSWVDRGPEDRGASRPLVDEGRETVRDGMPRQVLAQLIEVLVSEHLVWDPVHRFKGCSRIHQKRVSRRRLDRDDSLPLVGVG